jgi:hypothetical protein
MKSLGLGLIVWALAGVAQAEPYAVGSTLEAIELADQHDQPRRVDSARRALLFTRDMDAGDVLKRALAEDGAALLDAARAAYVSGMPALVLRLFALRKLRERPYPVLLDRDGSRTARLPAQTGKITFVALDALRITQLRYLGSVEEVRGALAAPGR